MSNHVYPLGRPVRITNRDNGSESSPFTDADLGGAIDPTGVSIWVRHESDAATVYVFGVDSEVQNPNVGEYYMDVTTDKAGKWYYGFEGTGSGATADERWFEVRPTHKA